MTFTPDQPPDDNETYESLDEAFDEAGLPGHGGGSEGVHDADDLVVDHASLEEVGGDLDDSDRIALLDRGMDDPDGSRATGGGQSVSSGDDQPTGRPPWPG